MPKTETRPSPARRLVNIVWAEAQAKSRHSGWTDFNSSMSSTLHLAISAGLLFNLDDFRVIYNEMRGQYWFGADSEHFYSAACKIGNISACKSYEAMCNRPPFLLHGERLYVGCQFPEWRTDRHVDVTSIGHSEKLGHYLVACSYKHSYQARTCRNCGGYIHFDTGKNSEQDSPSKIAHQFKITLAELKELTQERKAFVAACRSSEGLTVTREDVELWSGMYWAQPLLDTWFAEKASLSEDELVEFAGREDTWDHHHARVTRQNFRRHHKIDTIRLKTCVWDYNAFCRTLAGRTTKTLQFSPQRPTLEAVMRRIAKRICPDKQVRFKST